MLYFAYGSNMDWAQMRSRCPSAEFNGTACLFDYRLAFTRFSTNRGCGVADAVSATGNEVWGVIYKINDHDLESLDRSEGYTVGGANNAYERCTTTVFIDGNINKPMQVDIYFANAQEQPPLPNQTYKELIVNGATYWNLPQNYIEKVLNPIKVLNE